MYYDYLNCIEQINLNRELANQIPSQFYNKLVLVEDIRNKFHFGVDPFAIIRCIYQKIFKQKTQGGSTIEQQLVRTITGKYNICLKRKFKEQITAILICCHYNNKEMIGKSYLWKAYYGYGKTGYNTLSHSERENSSEVIARLKYPTQRDEPSVNNKKLTMRTAYINSMYTKYIK